MKQLILLLFLLSAISLYAQPANNSCLNAELVYLDSSGFACINGNTNGATTSGEIHSIPDCKPRALNEVWYKFVVSGLQNTITVYPSGADPIDCAVITVRSFPCGDLRHNGCVRGEIGADSVTMTFGAVPGTIYYVDVSGYCQDGEFNVCISSTDPPPIPGNTCDEATWVINKDTIKVQDLQGITSSGITPSCFKNGAANQDIWYKFQVSETGSLGWKVVPDNNAELDFAVFDITDGCPDVSDQQEVDDKMLSCNFNFSGAGNSDPVGMSDTSTTPCPYESLSTPVPWFEFCPSIEVQECKTYAIMVENFSGLGVPVGFDVEWSGSFEIDSLPGDSCIVGIDENELSELKIFPNPSSGVFTIELGQVDQLSILEVHNSLGQVVWTGTVSQPKFNIDLTHLLSGYYFLKVSGRNFVSTNRIIIQ